MTAPVDTDTYIYEPVENSDCEAYIMYKKEGVGEGGFWYSWMCANTRYYQILVLSLRGGKYSPCFEPAKRLYRRLKREGKLTKHQSFKYVAM